MSTDSDDVMDPYRELFERSADAILLIEGESFVDCNEAAVEMLRYADKAEVLKTHPSELSPATQPDGRGSREKASEYISIALTRGSHRFEWEHLRADGSILPVEVLLTAVKRGERASLHVVWRDLSERRELESRLRHAQKMEAVGRLAGGIAHDFNNFLVAILGNAELLEDEIRDDPELQSLVAGIREAGRRSASLVKQLMTFSRKQEVVPKIIDIGHEVERLHDFLKRLIGEDVRLTTVPPAGPLNALIDAGQFEQVVVNLVTNARDALPSGGRITLEVNVMDLGAGTTGSFGDVVPGAHVVLSVSDTGTGMEPDVVRRAFDPFFTTKEAGKGTGLGLATAYGIITQAGGTAFITSAPGEGTTVRVALPLAGGSSTAEEVPSEEAADGGNETILVVEDDDMVANVAVRILESKGYGLIVARDGDEALATWREREGSIDLLLTDVVMPGMSGPDLVSAIRGLGGQPRVLFVSGYTGSALSALEGVDLEIDLLAKPYSASQLALRVRSALDGEPRRSLSP